MANQFIRYEQKNGIEYAAIYRPRRTDGKKVNEVEYLGKVIDKNNGVFHSRAKGTFKYTLENGYSEYKIPNIDGEEISILDFGDIYLLTEHLINTGFYSVIQDTLPKDKDTLLAMTIYKVLSHNANCYAADWWRGSYASILFPEAEMSSQRLSEFLNKLGDESVQRHFFDKYLRLLCEKDKCRAILIDSTGLANKIDFNLAAINTHGGKTSRETRLILAVDRVSNMPLFFRYAAGNIVDVTTLRATITELAQYGIETKLTIIDAGYYSDGNVKSLLDNRIAFLTRVHTNRVIFKDLLKNHIEDLTNIKYLTKCNERLVYIKRIEITLFKHDLFAYIAIDLQRRNDDSYKYMQKTFDDLQNGKLTDSQIRNKLDSIGVFVLICTECIETHEILPMYYTRQAIEQIFDVNKSYVELLPLRVHNEDTFRGHLMLTFIASVAYLAFNRYLKESDLSALSVLSNARNLKCKVYKNAILVKEPAKITRMASQALEIPIPEFIHI